MKLILYGLIFIFIFFLSGCREQKKDPNTNEITITGEKGEKITFNNGQIPENFPKDIPIYPGSEITYSMTFTDKKINTISLDTKDSINTIEEYYKKELTGNGWKIKQVFATDKSRMFTGDKDDRDVTIGITIGSKNKNNIAISTNYKE